MHLNLPRIVETNSEIMANQNPSPSTRFKRRHRKLGGIKKGQKHINSIVFTNQERLRPLFLYELEQIIDEKTGETKTQRLVRNIINRAINYPKADLFKLIIEIIDGRDWNDGIDDGEYEPTPAENFFDAVRRLNERERNQILRILDKGTKRIERAERKERKSYG